MWPSRSLTQPGERPLPVNSVLATSWNTRSLNQTVFFPVFRRQMAEALKKLNVPVTVVLDAAVGYAHLLKVYFKNKKGHSF